MLAIPLVDRHGDAVLFRTPDGPVTASAFLAGVDALDLPGTGPVLNLCRGRYAFMVTFAAALRQGRPNLLCGEPTQALLDELGRAYPDAVTITDDTLSFTPRRGQAAPTIPATQLAAIVYTSGSTGASVAHHKHWGALVSRTRAAAARFGLDQDTIIGTVPPGHMYGFEVTALLPLHAPCASWCGPAFFPADLQAALAHCPAPRHLVTTPLHLRALLGAIPAGALRATISATAPLDPALATEAETCFAAPVLEIFGATECGSIASRRTLDGPLWTPYPDITLVPQADGFAATSPDMPPVPLADEIEREPDGRFRLVGRRADMVKLGGRRASLIGLNRILAGLEGVRDGIFVVPDDLDRRSTARLLAVVVAPGRSASSILAELRDRVDPLFLPRRVVHVDRLPRNALGKLPRQAVLDLLAETRQP